MCGAMAALGPEPFYSRRLRELRSYQKPTSSSRFVIACSCLSAPRALAANTAGLMAGSAALLWTDAASMRECAGLEVVGWPGMIGSGTGPRRPECTGLPANTEQRVPAWDIVDSVSRELEEARLDVATSDASTGAALFFDVVVKCVFSTDLALLRRRAQRDGCAA